MWDLTTTLGRVIWLCVVAAVPFLAAGSEETWVPRGGAPNLFGQTEGIANDPVSGAVNAVAPHPVDPDVLYIGSVNGGVWRTDNATATTPTWVSLSEEFDSLSIGDIAFDPTDPEHDTLVAGIGRFSSYGRRGGARTGLYQTVNAGEDWTHIGADLDDKNVIGVAPRGATIVVAINVAEPFSCNNIGVFRSTDSGAVFDQLTGGTGGIPAGVTHALASDPTDADILYASVVFASTCDGVLENGIYKSVDAGASWTKVSDAALDAFVQDTTSAIEIAVGNANNVFVATASGGRLDSVFRSGDGGSTWAEMDIPQTDERSVGEAFPDLIGIHPGGQASIHMSLSADPANAYVVYVGGDRQPLSDGDAGGFPNSIGARDFSGRLFRGDASKSLGSQWAPLTHSGTLTGSSPHADSRDMAFSSNGDLIQGDDGGVFRRSSPADALGDWFSLNGDLQITEAHSAVLDKVSNVLVTGNQDNGTSRQASFDSRVWQVFQGGDGGDVAVDELVLADLDQSQRYTSFQRFDGARRRAYNSANIFLGSTVLPLTVIEGEPLTGQFTTPIAVNQAEGGRLIIGASNGVYESLDEGDTVSEIGPGIRIRASGNDAIGYGALDNPEVLYVGGSRADPAYEGIFVRSEKDGELVPNKADLDVRGIAVDRLYSANAFYVSASSVYHTSDTGHVWVDVTGDLNTLETGALLSVEYAENLAGSALIVGAEKGVFVSLATDGFTAWARLGDNLPIAPVYELSYSADTDVLLASMLGRGTFTWSELLGNVPPEAFDDQAATNEGAPVIIDVLKNDIDLDGTLDPNSVQILDVPSNGAATPQLDGTVLYEPGDFFSGIDSFTYDLADDSGARSNSATVTISVNDIPEVVDDSAETNEASAVIVDVLANDFDNDGVIDSASLIIESDPINGVAQILEPGKIRYTPNLNFSGDDTLRYQVADDQGAVSAPATVSINVNARPIANDDQAATSRGTPIQIDVLANDTDSDGVLEPSSVVVVSEPSQGTASVDPETGEIIYTPNSTLIGFDRLGYRVADNRGAPSTTATVLVAVVPGPAAPQAADDEFVVTPNLVFRGDVSLNDEDPDGDPLSYLVVSPPTMGEVKMSAIGTFTYIPPEAFVGITAFEYETSDGAQTDRATVTLDVGDVIYRGGFE